MAWEITVKDRQGKEHVFIKPADTEPDISKKDHIEYAATMVQHDLISERQLLPAVSRDTVHVVTYRLKVAGYEVVGLKFVKDPED